MLGVLGLVAPLVNFSVGRVSANVPDRHITVRALPLLALCTSPALTRMRGCRSTETLRHLEKDLKETKARMHACAQFASIVVAGAGSFALMKGTFPAPSFFVAGTLVYMGTIVLEAVSMSLTSKVCRPSLKVLLTATAFLEGGVECWRRPMRSAVKHLGAQRMPALRVQVVDERMSQGLWNAGLLSTQAGTIGRLCGNLLLSACAKVTGAMTQAQIDSLARLMWGVSAGSMVFSLAYVISLYNRLLG